MRYTALSQRRCIRSRFFAVLVAVSVSLAPVLSMAMDLHELAHESGVAAAGLAHHASPDHHSVDASVPGDDDAPGGLHAVLHSVHCCGHGLGIPPSLIPLTLSSASLAPIPQPDELQISAVSALLFRPPRRD
jgi:hypothetical protein